MAAAPPALASSALGADHYRLPTELFERIQTKHSGVVGVCRLGPLTAPRLFYIHGFNNFTRVNSPLLLRLAESFRVLTCDLPGNGWTDPPAGGRYTPDAFLTCIYEVLLHAGWVSGIPPRPGAIAPKGYHLCGHSQGGMLTILAAEDPRFHRDILSVTAICPAGISMPYLKEGRSRFPRLYMSFIWLLCHILSRKQLARLVRKNIYPGFAELPPDIREFFVQTFDSYLAGDVTPAGPENAPVPGGPPGKFLYRALYMLQYFPWEECRGAYEAFCRDADLAGRKRVILAGKDTTCPAGDVLAVLRESCPGVLVRELDAGQAEPARRASGGAEPPADLEVIYYKEDSHEVPVYDADRISLDVKLGRVSIPGWGRAARAGGAQGTGLLPGDAPGQPRLEQPAPGSLESGAGESGSSSGEESSSDDGEASPPQEGAGSDPAARAEGVEGAEGAEHPDFSDLEEAQS